MSVMHQRKTEPDTKMSRKPDSTTMPLGEQQCNQNKLNRKALNDIQKSRLFACICVARHLTNASDCDEAFNGHIYNTTLELMQPHLGKLHLTEDELLYPTIKKIWTDFIRTGLVTGKLKSKLEPKTISRNRDESLERSRMKETNPPNYLLYGLVSLALLLPLLLLISAQEPGFSNLGPSTHIRTTALQMHFNRIDQINIKHPKLLTTKKLKTIRARVAMMQKEISIMMLLGRHRDILCKSDPTHCVARLIGNVTQLDDHGYIDASDSQLTPDKLVMRLADSLDDDRYTRSSRTVMVDNLSKLPGDQVMNLFQFVDKDEYNKRRGLLILVLYTDNNLYGLDVGKMRDAEIAERVLLPHWSPHIPSDTLTSVISRICQTIVRIH